MTPTEKKMMKTLLVLLAGMTKEQVIEILGKKIEEQEKDLESLSSNVDGAEARISEIREKLNYAQDKAASFSRQLWESENDLKTEKEGHNLTRTNLLFLEKILAKEMIVETDRSWIRTGRPIQAIKELRERFGEKHGRNLSLAAAKDVIEAEKARLVQVGEELTKLQ